MLLADFILERCYSDFPVSVNKKQKKKNMKQILVNTKHQIVLKQHFWPAGQVER